MGHLMILHCDLGENHQLKVVVVATQPQQALRIQRHEASTRNDANGTTRTLSAQGSTTTRPHPNRSRIVSALHPCSIRAVSAPYPRRIRVVSAPYPEASRIAEFKRSRMLAWPHRSNHERLLYGCCADGARMVSGYGPDAVRLRSRCYAAEGRLVPDFSALVCVTACERKRADRCHRNGTPVPVGWPSEFRVGGSLELSAADRAALISAGPGQAACRRNRQQQAPILQRRGDTDTLFP